MGETLATLSGIAKAAQLYEEGDSPATPQYIIVEFVYPPDTRMVMWIDASLDSDNYWEMAGGYVQSIYDLDTIIELIIQRYDEGWLHRAEADLSAFIEGQF